MTTAILNARATHVVASNLRHGTTCEFVHLCKIERLPVRSAVVRRDRRRPHAHSAVRAGRQPDVGGAARTRYIHHVPGRLRLQAQRFQEQHAATAACDAIRQIRGVATARSNPIIGSVTITYDRHRLPPLVLWKALRRLGLVSGPLSIQNGVPLTSAEVGASHCGTALQGFAGLAAQTVILTLLEHWTVALLGL